MVCIFPGRFQPFHKGHMYAIESIRNTCDTLIIVVENAGESFTKENPFTAGERIEMIMGSLKMDGKILIVPMENVGNNSEWVGHLRVMLPDFDICYSNNVLVRALMEREGIKVKGIDFLNRERYSGTEVRRRIAASLQWWDLVPEYVYNYITSRGLDRRIKMLYGDVL